MRSVSLFIALRPGAFLDQTPDYILNKITKGILPTFLSATYGMVYTSELAKDAAMAAIAIPDTELNSSIDIGWNPVNGEILAPAFASVLKKPIQTKTVIPSFALKYIMPAVARLNDSMHDMNKMINGLIGDY